MQERKAKLTWEAIYDVTDIADYIELEFGIGRADEFLVEFKRHIEQLKYWGCSLTQTRILYRGNMIYKKVFKPSIIFYIIDENQDVHILRVLRQEQDWESILKGADDYTYPD